MKFRRLAVRCVLILVSVGCALMLLEFATRYFFFLWNTDRAVPFNIFGAAYPASENLNTFIRAATGNHIPFEFKSNINAMFLEKPIRTNKEGVLGVFDYSYEKPDNVVRIVGIGDSLMSSWGVNQEDTYLALLEEQLNVVATKKQVQILNLAVPGYNTAIEYEVIKSKALAYHPDLIIIGYDGNDMDMPNFVRKKVVAVSYLFYVFQLMTERFSGNRRDVDTPELLVDVPKERDDRFLFSKEETPPEYRFMVGYENYLTTMENTASVTVKQGIPTIVVGELTEQMQNDLEVMGFYVNPTQRLMEQYLSQRNLPYAAVTISEKDLHLNELGHKLWFEFIYQFLLDHQLLEI